MSLAARMTGAACGRMREATNPGNRGACHRAGHFGPDPLAHPGYACSARHFSPAIVVLIDPDALAVGDLIQEPRGDDFSRRIFQAFYFVEQTVIDLMQKRVHQNIDLFEIAHEPARIEGAPHGDRDPVIVPMQIATPMTLRNKRKVMSRFKPIGSTDPCL